jgi:SAM-dependent methyltransferase
MYEAYPYPSPTPGSTLIEDLANSFYSLFGEASLAGWSVLDAGCGTGQRLLALASRYPEARFTGVDMTTAALEVAKALAQKHRLKNVEFHESDLLDFHPGRTFDVITSTGVVHHLEDPGRGLAALASLLNERGIVSVWLYHPLGEHQRLLDRELLLTMWARTTGLDEGIRLMRELRLTLETKRYGSSASQTTEGVSQRNIDVDAFLHPIVNAYRLEDAINMFRECAHMGWAAINNINSLDSSKLVDLAEVEQGDLRFFCQSVDDLFESPSLRARFRGLTALQKLRVMEIKLKPSGFTVVGGYGDSHVRLVARARGNVVALDRVEKL